MISKNLLALISKDASAFCKEEIRDVKLIGQGYYGLIFLVDFAEGFSCIAKVYKGLGHSENEFNHLKLLWGRGKFSTPKTYHLSLKERNGYKDIVYMEYIEGASSLESVADSKDCQRELAQKVIDNMLYYQQNRIKSEFGWKKTFSDYARAIYVKLNESSNDEFKALAEKYIRVMDDVVTDVDEVLLHGDYNTNNLLFGGNGNICMIDPFGFFYGDKYVDIAQLLKKTCLKGNLVKELKEKGLLYEEKIPLIRAYQFWDEMYHYLRTGKTDQELMEELRGFATI